MVIRNLILLLENHNVIEKVEDVGVITPYAAQSEIIFKTIKELGIDDVVCGTVHKFQGNEKNIIVFDIPESIPGEKAIQSNRSMISQSDINSDNAKLLNVAVTRARGLIFLICHKEFLLNNLGKYSILRTFINNFEKKGKIVDSGKILDYGPNVDFENPFPNVDPATIDSVTWLDEKIFDDKFLNDVKKAKKWIIIYSGFCSEKRLAKFSDIFKQKISKGVKIRCVVPPASDQTFRNENAKKCIDEMLAMGITVDLVSRIHDKTAFIDDDIVYFGSLNILSFAGGTGERMFVNKSKTFSETKARFEIRNLHFVKNKSYTEYLSEKQNPDCKFCGGLMVLKKPSVRNYAQAHYVCAQPCNEEKLWENEFLRNKFRGTPPPDENLQNDKSDEQPTSDEENLELGSCPREGCNGELVVRVRKRDGKKFKGCSKFPRCKYTEN